MAEKQIGKVVHYFDRAMAAVVKLSDEVKVGDSVKFAYHEDEFIEPVESMEVDHQKVKEGKKGDEVAIKVIKPTHENAIVYKEE